MNHTITTTSITGSTFGVVDERKSRVSLLSDDMP